MGNFQADLTDIHIVELRNATPLIKHQQFVGTLKDLSNKISRTRLQEQEARAFIKKTIEWIELTSEWCELADDKEEIARNRE